MTDHPHHTTEQHHRAGQHHAADRNGSPDPHQSGNQHHPADQHHPSTSDPTGADDVISTYLDALNSVGVVREWPLTAFDITGVPVSSVVWTAQHCADEAYGVGYGPTPAAARIGALGETAERVVMRAALRALPVRVASYRELVEERGTRLVADPLTLTLPAGSPYSPDSEIAWVPTVRWRTGEEVLAPLEFVASGPSGLPAGGPEPLITPITNGLGAGDTVERAVGHALLELVQRDGDTVSFRALDQGVVVDLTTLTDPAAIATVAALRGAGIEPVVKVASTEFACVVYAMGRQRQGRVPPLADTAIGEAADPDGQRAIGSALLEFASSRARRAVAFGPIDEVARLLPDYHAHEITLPIGPQEVRALQEMRGWANLSPADSRALAEPMLSHTVEVVSAGELPAAPPLTPAALLDTMLDRLADFDVLTVTGRIGDIHAAKVLAPGLEVETLSYLRIGGRVLQRLLDRGSPLVGLGPADQPGRLPIRLPESQLDRFGGAAWLDETVVQATMGSLYPLYREPRRHAVDRVPVPVEAAPGPGPA